MNLRRRLLAVSSHRALWQRASRNRHASSTVKVRIPAPSFSPPFQPFSSSRQGGSASAHPWCLSPRLSNSGPPAAPCSPYLRWRPVRRAGRARSTTSGTSHVPSNGQNAHQSEGTSSRIDSRQNSVHTLPLRDSAPRFRARVGMSARYPPDPAGRAGPSQTGHSHPTSSRDPAAPRRVRTCDPSARQMCTRTSR